VAPVPLDRQLEITVGDVDPVPLLEPVLRPVGAVAAQGYSQAPGNAHPDHGQDHSYQRGGGDVPVPGGRKQDRVGSPSDYV
jgi:hypothetical protein